MDTSETYTKMRLAAIPDLGLGTPILSAMFVVTEDVFVDNKGDFYIHCDRAPYWCQLERQDQLQAMVPSTGVLLNNFGQFFYEFFGGFEKWGEHCETWERLWLAFVMKELNSKRWDGEQWTY